MFIFVCAILVRPGHHHVARTYQHHHALSNCRQHSRIRGVGWRFAILSLLANSVVIASFQPHSFCLSRFPFVSAVCFSAFPAFFLPNFVIFLKFFPAYLFSSLSDVFLWLFSWAGTKRKPIHVISTFKRPVPLFHYLWTANHPFKGRIFFSHLLFLVFVVIHD